MAGAATRTPTDVAWAAGLFEGEGCFSFDDRSLKVVLAMTDVDIVDRFARVMGFGHRRMRENQHISDKRGWKQEWKPVHFWSVSNFEHAQALIAMFWPYLGQRRRARAVELLQAKRVDRLRAYRARGRSQRKGN